MCYGIQFTNQARHKYAFPNIFDQVCDERGIEHRLIRINHSVDNGRVERMNRTIKDATVKRFSLRQLRTTASALSGLHQCLQFGRRLKTLKSLTPEFIYKAWTLEPDRFTLDPVHQMLGPNT